MYFEERVELVNALRAFLKADNTTYSCILEIDRVTKQLKRNILDELTEYDNFDNGDIGVQARIVIEKVKEGDIAYGIKWLGERD